MKEVLVGAGSSLVATVIGYVVLDVLFDGWRTEPKVAGALALGGGALVVALWASRNGRRDSPGAVRLASDLGGSGVLIEDVHAQVSPGQDVAVGSNIQAHGPVTIKRTTIDSMREKKK